MVLQDKSIARFGGRWNKIVNIVTAGSSCLLLSHFIIPLEKVWCVETRRHIEEHRFLFFCLYCNRSNNPSSMMPASGPDSGYSWVIMLCCTFINFAMFGLFRSWGVIYVALLQDYDVSRQLASWPFSMCSSILMLIGPSVSIITHYMSNRTACLLGCSIATIGVMGCYFATNILWITIFYGVINGFGFGVVCVLVPVFLNQYFLKYRATAIGIAFSGSSFGAFVLPIVMERLLEEYSLRGTFLILSGLVMNTVIAAALLRPTPCLRKSNKSKRLEDSKYKDSGISISGDVPNEVKNRISDVTFSNICDCVLSEDTQQNNTNETFQLDSSDPNESGISGGNYDRNRFRGSVKNALVDSSHSPRSGEIDTEVYCEYQAPLMLETHVYIKPKDKGSKNRSSVFQCSAYLSVMEILRNPMFHLLTYSGFIYFLVLHCYYIVIVDYTGDKGIPEEEGIYLMSIFSIADLVARCGLGWITDNNYVKRKNMFIFDIFAIGLFNHLYPFIDDLKGLQVATVFYGIVTGSCISLLFVLEAEYLGMERLTLAIGLESFMNGLLSLFRPVMIGYFRDQNESYDWMFHSFGIACITFALMWLAEPWIAGKKTSPNQCSKEGT